jgi:signal transduction histidine kinase
MVGAVTRRDNADSLAERHNNSTAAGDLVFLIDDKIELVAANDGFWRLLGCPQPRPGVSLEQLRPVWGPELVRSCRRLLTDQEKVGTPEVRRLLIDATGVPLTVTLTPIRDAGGSLIIGGRLQNRIEPSKHDIQIDNYPLDRGAFLSRLTQQIAHELRNPCTIIGGFAALLKRSLRPADKLNEYAAIIVAETLRLEKTLAEVLNFSQSQSSDRSYVDLNEVAVAAVEAVRQAPPEKRGRLNVVECPQPLPVAVNHEQAVRSLYDIIFLVSEELPEEIGLDIGLTATGAGHKVVIGPVAQPQQQGMVSQKLAAMFSQGGRRDGLRLTLAIEAIRLNGGEFNVTGAVDSGTQICIEYPVVEEPHVKDGHGR